MVGDGVDEQARQQPDQAEDAGEFEQQPAAELACAQSQGEPAQRDGDGQAQHRGDGDVAPDQPLEVGLQALAVLGGQHEQEGQHQHAAGDGDAGNDPRPAVGLDGAHGGALSAWMR